MDNLIASSENHLRQRPGVGVRHFEPNVGTLTGRTGEHYVEHVASQFTATQRQHTTILIAGLTVAQDRFLAAALRGLGYRIQVLDVPDNDALRVGKEFGNRGQCNPTYFTVGNLVKFLMHLRDNQGYSVEEIKKNYVFFTAGACGPCRFGTYVTEYRKALRDAGFDGFRILSGSQTAGIKQEIGEGQGLQMTARMFLKGVHAFVLGDILNGLMYRIRPYEVNPGETDTAIEQCRQIIEMALEANTSLVRAVWQCRQRLAQVPVDRSLVKPKVAIIGEFWAMTTEGDGNYHLQRFLESEGAEVDIQFISAWMMYLIWQLRYDTRNRQSLKRADKGRRSLQGINVWKRYTMLWTAEKALKAGFQFYAHLMGFKGYQFTDMEELARISHEFYDVDNRGGEGHMEVGKLILNVVKNKVNMTISVKPFGCMPSSGVSDGVQSLITERYPDAIFLPIETTGDGAVNVYSRIQMQLFKARQKAQREFDLALTSKGLSLDALRLKLTANPRLNSSLHHSPHQVGCTAADLAYEV